MASACAGAGCRRPDRAATLADCPPYGYQATRGGKQLTVHPEEAQVVRRIFNLRRSGLTRYAIAARLNDEGIPTREGKR